jgi:hypothetical protein
MRKTHHSRGKGHLGTHLGGKRVKEHKNNAPDLFAKKPKASEPDNVGRRVRPAAHNARQKGVAKRASRAVRRLGDGLI